MLLTCDVAEMFLSKYYSNSINLFLQITFFLILINRKVNKFAFVFKEKKYFN